MPPLRRDVVDRLTREAAAFAEKVAETAEAARLSAVAVERTEAEKASAAEAEAKGAISPQAARKRFEAAAETARRHAGEAERLTLLGAKLEAELVERRRLLAQAEYEAEVERAERAGAAANSTAKKLAALLAQVADVAGELSKKRATREAAIARAVELRPEGAEFSLDVDEPAWRPEAWEAIVELLTAGPQTPGAVQTSAIDEQRARRRARLIGDVVEQAARTGREPDLAELPEEMREDARLAYEGRLEVDATASRTRERTLAIETYVESGDESALAGFEPNGGTWTEARRRRELRLAEERRAAREQVPA